MKVLVKFKWVLMAFHARLGVPSPSVIQTLLVGGRVTCVNMQACNSYSWRRDYVVLLIQLYEKYPCLWKVGSPEYKRRYKRGSAMQCVHETFLELDHEIKIDDIKKKLHTLRSQYKKEVNLIEKSLAAGENYQPKLWCFDLLSFLQDSDEVEDYNSFSGLEVNIGYNPIFTYLNIFPGVMSRIFAIPMRRNVVIGKGMDREIKA